ncbi:MAG: hypothetical protein ACLFQV_13805 [Vulcanimicrobiota bacterium]
MSNVKVTNCNKEDLDILIEIIYEAWNYYVQDVDKKRLNDLVAYYENSEDDSKRFLVAHENGKVVGVAEITLTESYRCEGEEAHLELLYIRDEVENYYDVHKEIMDTIFKILQDEDIEMLRVDTTLENSEIVFI